METQEEKRGTIIFRDRFTNKVIEVKVMAEVSSEETEAEKKMKELLY